MLENMFTTKMSMDKKSLQQRFSKIRSKDGKASTIAAIIIFFIVIVMIAVSAIYAAIRKSNEYAMSDTDFAEFVRNPIGSDMAKLDYADDDKAVFHYGNGFFITNENAQEIEHKIDLNKLNISIQSQGDTALGVHISKNGKYAYLLSYGQDADKFDEYIINLNNGNVKKGKMPENAELYGDYIETFTMADTVEGWNSVRAVRNNDKIYYLNLPFGEVGNIQLVAVDNTSAMPADIRYIFGEKFISDTAKREQIIKGVLAEGESIVPNSRISRVVGVKEVKAVTYLLSELTKIKIFDEKDGAYEIATYDTRLNNKISPRICIFNIEADELIFTQRLDLTGHYSGTGEFYTRLLNTIDKIDNNFIVKNLIGMKDATLIMGNNRYSPTDSEALTRLETILSTATIIKMGGTGCPFDAELIILDKNNQAMRVELATDGCAVFRAGGIYYDYSDKDNAKLYSLFGIDVKNIPH